MIDQVGSFIIENNCSKNLLCEHKCTVFIKQRKITSFPLNADEIGALYDLFGEKVFYIGEEKRLHFQGIPQYAMRSQEQLNKLKEKTTEKINRLLHEAIRIQLA